MWKRALGRPRRRRMDNIRIDLQDLDVGIWTEFLLDQDKESCRALVNAVTNILVPLNAVNILCSFKPVRFSKRILHRGVSK